MIWSSKDYYFSRLGKEDLPELLSYYIEEIYGHFRYTDYTRASYENEINNLLKEDLVFYNESIYNVIRNFEDKKIYGSIRITYWDKKIKLPIEKLFDISGEDLLLLGAKNFWHIGRFVISRKIQSDRISILKKMLFNAFYPVYALKSGLIIAECDKKVTTTLGKMGVKTFVLGKSIEYICSETVPIYIRSEWLDNFINSNADKYLYNNNLDDVSFFIGKANLDDQSIDLD